jgi:hypothetical protein
MSNPNSFAHVVALAIKAALAPLRADLATLTERTAGTDARLAAIEPTVALVRERVAVAEVRPFLPGPAGTNGTDGKDGAPGVDGFTVDELVLEQDPTDERLVTLAYRRGETTRPIGTLRFAIPRYCGVYADGRRYTKGDQVTYASALWSCTASETRAKPGSDGDGWTLQVKRGEGR